MKLRTEPYNESLKRLPKTGQQIIGYQDGDSIVVYQAYKKSIAEYAVQHQLFGGSDFSYNRMSWIKPNFLWMMYRCGWAEKENQEKVLALWMDKKDFETILNQAVLSSFNSKLYKNEAHWKNELENKEVRLQWDPDHDPYGNKLERRAIQLGLKGKLLENFGTTQIQKIEDITNFVREQKQFVDSKQLDKLWIPVENVYTINNKKLNERILI